MSLTRPDPDVTPEHVAAALRERIYGAIACLSTLLVLVGHLDADGSAWTPFVEVAVATGALWAASLFADYVAHVAAHGQGPRGREAAAALRASGQILQASALPLLLLAVAGIGGMSLAVAMRIGIWALILSLGLFALLAARRTALPAWKRAVLVVALVALGGLVVALKTLAH